jgi:hypothetical protein
LPRPVEQQPNESAANADDPTGLRIDTPQTGHPKARAAVIPSPDYEAR